MNYLLDKLCDWSSLLQEKTKQLAANHKNIVRIMWIVLIAISLIAIGYQIVQDWQEFRTYPWQLRWGMIALSFGVYSVSISLTSLIWASIMRHLSNIESLKFHLRTFCLTNLARRLPTILPYIGARTEAYATQGLPRKVTLSATVVEMVNTIMGAIVTTFLTLPFGPYALIVAKIPKITLLLLILPTLLIIRPDWLFDAINLILVRIKRPRLKIKIRTLDMLIWTGLFTIIWANGGVLYYLLTLSIYPIDIERIPFVINILAISGIAGWIGQILFFLPVLPLRQLMFAYLLSLAGIPFPAAVAIAILSRLCIMGFELIWAILSSLLLQT